MHGIPIEKKKELKNITKCHILEINGGDLLNELKLIQKVYGLNIIQPTLY